MQGYLTKSKYLSGLQCIKRLWIEEHAPEKVSPVSLAQRRILDQGKEVGIKARDYFQDGILVDSQSFEGAIKQTQELIQGVAACIFEAAFVVDDIGVRCDALQREADNSWKVVEVKSSTKVKDEHLPDVAFQNYVLSALGCPISTLSLMHINSECVYPDLTNLFTIEDITPQALPSIDMVADNIRFFRTTLGQDIEPIVTIGRHCDKPVLCPVKDYCWESVPEYSIFTIPRISANKMADLLSIGVISIFDLPSDYPLSNNQSSYISTVLDGKARIDKEAINKMLAGYEYPIHFLDFETYNPAIPRFDGLKPYQQYPFQYSCHVLQEDGTIDHFEYLHMDTADPRLLFVESLVNHVTDNGSVVVYYAPFERKILTDLALFAPQLAPALESITDRFVDQMDIFKNHYSHPRFLGSNSLKNVLPVIVPSLNYEDLNVRGGSDAQAIWDLMINSTNEGEKSRMASDLKAYCRMDTLAMVEIHKALLQM